MKRLFILVFLSFFVTLAGARESLELLIGEIERKDDLSQKTKRESVGHMSVFTRQDIDNLHLYTLKDLIKYMHFLNYNESNYGLPDPPYVQTGMLIESAMRIYIDNQALTLSYQGNALKYFGQIHLRFIDHIEVYWGTPSFSFGIDSASTVVKLYTKKPARENVTVLGTQINSSGSFNSYGYSAHNFDDFSYLLSINSERLKRKKFYYEKDFPLSREQKTNYLYSSFQVGKSKFTFSATKGDYDGFLGESVFFKPIRNKINFKHLYFGWDYELQDDYKIYMGYSNSNTKIYSKVDQNSSILATLLDKIPTIIDRVIDEELLEIHLTKHFIFGRHSFDVGYRGRYKHFKFDRYKIDEKSVLGKKRYDRELKTSLYAEDTYFIDSKNLLMGSFRYNYFARNADALHNDSINTRLGYVHNEKSWFNKSYILYSKNDSDNYHFMNYVQGSHKKNTGMIGFTNELGLVFEKAKISLMGGVLREKEKAPNKSARYKVASFDFLYQFNALNRISGIYWINDASWNNYLIKNQKVEMFSQGGYIALFNSFGKFDFANSLHFNRNDMAKKNYFNYDLAITYNFSRNLEFYLKGTNLLNLAAEGSYYGMDDKSGELIVVKPSLYDRVVWFGVEYSF